MGGGGAKVVGRRRGGQGIWADSIIGPGPTKENIAVV